MPWTKLKKKQGKFTHKSPSGKLWTKDMIAAYLAKTKGAKGLKRGHYGR